MCTIKLLIEPFKKLLFSNRFQSVSTVHSAFNSHKPIVSQIRVLNVKKDRNTFMSIAVEEGAWSKDRAHIVDIEGVVLHTQVESNVGGRMVMPSDSVYQTDFIYDPDLSVTVGIRSGKHTDFIHVKPLMAGKKHWDEQDHIQVVFTLNQE